MHFHPNWGHPDHDACGTGFVARLRGSPSHEIVQIALTATERLSHRGGVDADGVSGDGAGLLTALPVPFFRARALSQGIRLPEQFGVGVLFIPERDSQQARDAIQLAADREGIQLLGWRRVPTENDALGQRARESLPEIWHFFVAPRTSRLAASSFEWRLVFLRKRAESLAPAGTYICSLSSRTIVYKGLLTPWQLPQFYSDLRDPSFETSFAIFHQRYSTNTQPSWNLAQPFRYVAHNGEINTIVANRRWLRARENQERMLLAADSCFHILEENVSDSASFDNAFEMRLVHGEPPDETMLCMVPPAFENDPALSREIKDALASFSRPSEPWDGPAALIFSDGQSVGAKLDRNGLRPMRYIRTRDDLLIVGSEVGLADFEESRIAERQRLGPGEMILANPAAGLFLRWKEIIKKLGGQSRSSLPRLIRPTASPEAPATLDLENPRQSAAAFGWTEDQFRIILSSLAHGKEANWSMGDDAPPAFLSGLPRTLWDYCKQRFAQVTNPPIDPLREAHVMSLEVPMRETLVLPSPVLDPGQLAELSSLLGRPVEIDFTFQASDGILGAHTALAQLHTPMSGSARPGLVLLSDRDAGRERAALPALLALAAVWKAMVKEGMWDVPLVIETGQVFDTHHIALLVAAGASAVAPYLAFHFAEELSAGNTEGKEKSGSENFHIAVQGGLRKILARMGISALASYRNSHLFEVIGLEESLSAEYFEDAASYLGGKNLDGLFADYLEFHSVAFSASWRELADAGLFRYRKGGEHHATSPSVVRRMHAFVKSPSPENFAHYEQLAADPQPGAIRDLLEVVPGQPVSLEETESEESILRLFSTQAMSLGSLSPKAHRTLAHAMNTMGARSNTGEGGEDPLLYASDPLAANKIKQVASARFGVTAEYLVRAEELEIKIAQGSKPGEGGQLPAQKVSEYIARIRHTSPGTPLISPPPHHDIYSIEDLAQLIYDLRAVNPRARIGVKLVSGTGIGIIAAGVVKAGATVVTISGHNGGTGSSPLTSIKNTGLPWEIGLHETHETLLHAGLRSRVSLRADGGFKFARDVIIAAILGADEFGFGTASLLAIGCVMARQCHLNTCPVGIATQDEALRSRFTGKPEMVISYFRALATEIRGMLARVGVRSLKELVGDGSKLRARAEANNAWLQPLLENNPGRTVELAGCTPPQVPDSYDIVWRPQPSADGPGTPINLRNAHRTIGARWTSEMVKARWLPDHKDEDYEATFCGTAGQSFGAFLASGVTLRLVGDANDYVAKSLSGGTVSVSAGELASRRGDVLVGNTVLYGATSGQLFVAGRAGERFAIRNSGAAAVVEGVGQHGCEYMTAGVVAILGSAGLNFGSGMTGGLAYMSRADALGVLNSEFVALAGIEQEEDEWLRILLGEHVRHTKSSRAKRLLSRHGLLPLMRVQPVHFSGSIEATWQPVLAGILHKTPGSGVAIPSHPHLAESAVSA
jgi:glutamate synthase domain-containing protein 2/glutamate synthase domain-containing protein 1/glutamate synthase domain-containing protein 3